MLIRPNISADHSTVVALWERSVRATHDFLTEEDIIFFRAIVDKQTLANCEIHVAIIEEKIVGFIGLDNMHIDMLFIDPDYHRQRIGRKLIHHAQILKGNELSVEVNENNIHALNFYLSCGFAQTGRSEIDGFGRSFPILHLTYENCG